MRKEIRKINGKWFIHCTVLLGTGEMQCDPRELYPTVMLSGQVDQEIWKAYEKYHVEIPIPQDIVDRLTKVEPTDYVATLGTLKEVDDA